MSNAPDFFPKDSIMLDNSRYTDVTLSVPLKYINDKNSIYLWEYTTDANEFTKMVKLWNQEGRGVYPIVWPRHGFDSISSKLLEAIEFRHEATFLIEVSKVKWEWYTFSNKRVESEHSLEVYRAMLSYTGCHGANLLNQESISVLGVLLRFCMKWRLFISASK